MGTGGGRSLDPPLDPDDDEDASKRALLVCSVGLELDDDRDNADDDDVSESTDRLMLGMLGIPAAAADRRFLKAAGNVPSQDLRDSSFGGDDDAGGGGESEERLLSDVVEDDEVESVLLVGLAEAAMSDVEVLVDVDDVDGDRSM